MSVFDVGCSGIEPATRGEQGKRRSMPLRELQGTPEEDGGVVGVGVRVGVGVGVGVGVRVGVVTMLETVRVTGLIVGNMFEKFLLTTLTVVCELKYSFVVPLGAEGEAVKCKVPRLPIP